MSANKLNDILLSLVRQYGIEQVEQSLRMVHDYARADNLEDESTRLRSKPYPTSSNTKKRNRPKKTASRFVANLPLDPEHRTILSQLAQKFDEKLFLPTISDIRLFCDYYGIDAPNSRAGAISRIFRFLSSTPATHARKILQAGTYSGPSRLGPIADAIRRNARYKVSTEVSRTGSTDLSSDTPKPKLLKHSRSRKNPLP